MEDENFLLAEYKHFSESFWKNEELGEKRVNFFIALCTAIIAGLVALMNNEKDLSPDTITEITLAVLSILFLFGVVTFLRMLKRNEVTDEFKNILDYLRNQLRSRSQHLEEYDLPFHPRSKRFLKGGLAETVALMNSIILALVVVLSTEHHAKWVVAVLVFGLAFAGQVYWASKRKKHQPTQFFRANVAAIIFGKDGRILAFERKDIPGIWQLPQGGLDIGEGPRTAVEREILEETGIHLRYLHFKTKHPVILGYELPREYRKKYTGRGQAQYWFWYEFTGGAEAITLGDKKEFSKWKWMTMEEMLDQVVLFRKPVYEELAKAHGKLMEERKG